MSAASNFKCCRHAAARHDVISRCSLATRRFQARMPEGQPSAFSIALGTVLQCSSHCQACRKDALLNSSASSGPVVYVQSRARAERKRIWLCTERHVCAARKRVPSDLLILPALWQVAIVGADQGCQLPVKESVSRSRAGHTTVLVPRAGGGGWPAFACHILLEDRNFHRFSGSLQTPMNVSVLTLHAYMPPLFSCSFMAWLIAGSPRMRQLAARCRCSLCMALTGCRSMSPGQWYTNNHSSMHTGMTCRATLRRATPLRSWERSAFLLVVMALVHLHILQDNKIHGTAVCRVLEIGGMLCSCCFAAVQVIPST
eukprot:363049-Chlamydomonas_euryale.AAC.16